jgi:hypothetical protein
MAIPTRIATGLAIAVSGSLYFLVFGGGTIMGCLGPLNVTAVRCAAHSGLRPTEGPGVGLVVASIALGILVAVARSRAAWPDVAAALAGAMLGAIAYFARRPIALQGPDYDGTWLTVPLPVEGWTLLFWTLAGALVGLAALASARAVRDLRGPASRD